MNEDSDEDKEQPVPDLLLNRPKTDAENNDDATIDDTDNFEVSSSFVEDDDAAVILQELASNFGISARNTPAGSSATIMSTLAKSVSRKETPFSPRSLLRDCMTKVLVDVSRKTKVTQPQFRRLLSAKRNHINELSNDIIVLQRKIKDLVEQNRVLVRISKRQEMALKRYHDIETNLPHVLEMHKTEIKTLGDKLRKATEANKRDAEAIKKYDARLLRQNDKLTQLRILTAKKKLPDREVLSQKLDATQRELQEKSEQNLELNRRLVILQKSLTQQVSAEIDRHRVTSRKLSKLQLEHEKTLEKLQAYEKELASLQPYRTRSIRGLSSAFSSTTNISTSTETQFTTSASSSRRFTRKSISRKLKPSSLHQSDASSSSGERARTATIRKSEIEPCPMDGTSTTVLDLSLEKSGWTSECQIISVGSMDVESQSAAERKNSGKLPPLSGDMQERKKSSGSSDNLSSPEDGSSENHSKSRELQTSSLAIDESVSRKTTIQSSWSDTTRDGDFTMSRSNSPASTTPPTNGGKEEGSEDEFFNQDVCPVERCFSLIENYPPKERKKFNNGVDPGTNSDSSSQGTNSPPRDVDTITCNTPCDAPLLSKVRLADDLSNSRGASAVRRNSITRRNSVLSCGVSRAFSALSIEDRESSYTQTDPLY